MTDNCYYCGVPGEYVGTEFYAFHELDCSINTGLYKIELDKFIGGIVCAGPCREEFNEGDTYAINDDLIVCIGCHVLGVTF